MPGNRVGAFNTLLLHLRLTCITFMVGQLITFITYGAKLLNADWLRQRAFFLNHEAPFW